MNDSEHQPSDSGAQIGTELRARILKLASSMSVFEIAKRPGMPDAGTIYREFWADPEYGRAYKRARAEFWQRRREEIAEQINRAQQGNISCIFVELKRLRRLRDHNKSNYDLNLLHKDELKQLDALLAKATPPHLIPPK